MKKSTFFFVFRDGFSYTRSVVHIVPTYKPSAYHGITILQSYIGENIISKPTCSHLEVVDFKSTKHLKLCISFNVHYFVNNAFNAINLHGNKFSRTVIRHIRFFVHSICLAWLKMFLSYFVFCNKSVFEILSAVVAVTIWNIKSIYTRDYVR